MNKLKTFLKIAGALLLLACIFLTGYYYIYLGFIADKNIENKTIVPTHETVILNEVEKLYNINDLLNKETTFNKNIKQLIEEHRQGTMSINISIQDPKLLNELFNHDFFDSKLGDTYINILVNYGWTINNIYINGKINGRTLKIVWKYDNAYVYIDEFVWNWIFSMINAERLDFYLNDLDWYITYDSLKNTKFDFIPLSMIDVNIWESKVDLFNTILWWVEKIFTCNTTECYISVNKNTILKLKLLVDSNSSLSITQKNLIVDLSEKLFSYINGTNINLWSDNFNIFIKSSTLPISVDVSYDANKRMPVEFDYKQYTYKYLEDVLNDFNKNNSFFISIMHWNNDIVDSLLK